MNPHAASERPPVQQTLLDLGIPVSPIVRRTVVHQRKGAPPAISPEGYQQNAKPKEPPCPMT